MQDVRAVAPEKPWQTAVYLGMALFIISEAFLFGSLFWTYYYLRDNTPVWPPEGVDLNTVLVSVNTAVLLSSSLTMLWAARAIRQGSREGLVAGLVATLLLGATFLSISVWEWSHQEFRPWDHAYGSIFYTLTGFHGAHVLGGLLILLVLLIRALRRRFSAQRYLAVEVGGLYWHFVDFIWIFVFSSIFVIR
ncbi:MAG: heme-copper oxidase subunit III [Anaerolineae bacterium]